jgi:hypothetical protein
MPHNADAGKWQKEGSQVAGKTRASIDPFLSFTAMQIIHVMSRQIYGVEQIRRGCIFLFTYIIRKTTKSVVRHFPLEFLQSISF